MLRCVGALVINCRLIEKLNDKSTSEDQLAAEFDKVVPYQVTCQMLHYNDRKYQIEARRNRSDEGLCQDGGKIPDVTIGKVSDGLIENGLANIDAVDIPDQRREL